MKHINWGMIGCGDVTEVKSGPAFSKVPNSKLLGVVSRNPLKAADYAKRHAVEKTYERVSDMLSDPAINAVYIATPPSSHKEFTIQCFEAGKKVYVEKPMCLDSLEADEMRIAAASSGIELSVAHYRRAQPKFLKIKSLLKQNEIGKVESVTLRFSRNPLKDADLKVPKTAWRVDPSIAGGGLFHDLAPHQLDLLLFYFGKAISVSGNVLNSNPLYQAPDIIEAKMEFGDDIHFAGKWDFCDEGDETDEIVINGTNGCITFSAFGKNECGLQSEKGQQAFGFETLPHVQQPMIAEVVKYFMGQSPNPCSVEEGALIMEWIDAIVTGS